MSNENNEAEEQKGVIEFDFDDIEIEGDPSVLTNQKKPVAKAPVKAEKKPEPKQETVEEEVTQVEASTEEQTAETAETEGEVESEEAEAEVEETEAEVTTEEAETEEGSETTEGVETSEEAGTEAEAPSPADDQLARFRNGKVLDEKKVMAAVEEVEKEIIPLAHFGRLADEVLMDADVRVAFWRAAEKAGKQIPERARAEIIAADAKAEAAKAPPAPKMTDAEAKAKFKQLLLEDEAEAHIFWHDYKVGSEISSLKTQAQKEATERQKAMEAIQIRQQQEAAMSVQRQQLIAMAKKFPTIAVETGRPDQVIKFKDPKIAQAFFKNVSGMPPDADLGKIMSFTLHELNQANKKPEIKKVAKKPDSRPQIKPAGVVKKKTTVAGIIGEDDFTIE